MPISRELMKGIQVSLGLVLFALPLSAQWVTSAPHVYINGGNVGIGTSTPAYPLSFSSNMGDKLSLWKSAGASHFGMGVQTSLFQFYTSTPSGDFAFGSGTSAAFAEVARIKGNGFLGLGTAAPQSKLVVSGSDPNNQVGAGTQAALKLLNRDASTGGRLAELQFGYSDTTRYAAISGSISDAGSNTRGDILFSTRNLPADANLTERVRINGSGDVGIGTASPVTKLHVVGNVTVTGNISAKYQDLAEWVPADRDFAAGTVVVLDLRDSNRVTTTSIPYDTAVAGVISSQPGIMLGEAGEGKVMVATTGRVKLKVDTTNGPVRIGDLLVTSERPGIAMKSQPVDLGGVHMHRPGTIVAKALERLDSGQGEILVLLTLQ